MLPPWFRILLLGAAVCIGVLLVRGTTGALIDAVRGSGIAPLSCNLRHTGCVSQNGSDRPGALAAR